MIIKDGFVLQELVDDYIVVPVGDKADQIHGIIKLNSTGAFLWKLLSQNDQTEESLVKALTEQYTTDLGTAREDVTDFINVIKAYGCL